MKSLRIFYLTVITILAGMFFTACENKDFEAGPEVDGAQVYFPSYTVTEYSVGDDVSSIAIPINRIDKESALTVQILCNDESGLFSVPATATFKAGESATSFDISFDRTALVDGTSYPVSLLLNDEDNTTPYGDSQLNIVITPWPWELYKDGKGKLRGADVFCGLWEMDYMAEIDVTVYKHKSQSGIYMIENPWAMVVTAGWEYEDPLDVIKGYYNHVDTNFIINCTNPNAVYIEEQSTGLTHPNYGEWVIASLYPEYSDKVADAGKLENGIITFPEKGLLFSMLGYKDGTWYYGNINGMFRILLPGAEVTDYSLAVEYDGMKVEADGETASAIINFSYGADVTGIKYVVAGALSNTEVATVTESIFNNTAENVNVITNLDGEPVSEKFALTESGAYTVVAVALDKTGQPTDKGIAVINFFFPGMGGATAPDCDLEVMLGYVSEYWPAMASQCPDETSLFYEIDGSEFAALKIGLWKTDVVNNGGLTPEEIVDGYGSDASIPNTEGNPSTMDYINERGFYGSAFINLTPGTSYTFIVKATNIYGKSAVKTATYSTKAESFDDYEGELVIGKYYMTCTPGSDPFENTFTIKPVSGSTTEYTITDLGLDDNGYTSWHAEYDATASKFTVSGIEVGYEQYGNQFGQMYGYWDNAQTMIYAFLSISPDNAESTGSDPCVFSVDPTTKKISALETTFIVPVYQNNEAQTMLGSAGYFTAGTPVTYVGDNATATAKSTKASVKNMPNAGKYAVKNGNMNRNRFASVAKTAKAFKAERKLATLKVNAQACEPLQKGVNRNIKSCAASLKALK